jgi:gliding motility-associated-like protein
MIRHNTALFLFLCFLLCSGLSVAQNPKIFCTSVDPSGNVTVTWDNVSALSCASTATFDVLSSTSLNGTYTIIGSNLASTQTSFIHTGAGATDMVVYYKVIMKCNSQSFPSDPLATIFITINCTEFRAALTWNNLDPVNNTSYQYEVFKEFPAQSGTWKSLSKSSSLSYNDDNVFCLAPRYYVESRGPTCSSTSNYKVGCQDKVPPPITEISTVTVDLVTGKSNIFWSPNSASDTRVYYILTKKNQQDPSTLDSVFGRNNVTYVDQNSTPSTASFAYLIIPFDSCRQFSRYGYQVHRTIFLQVQSDLCRNSASLSWNKYQNWPGGVSKYEIYENGTLVNSVDSNTTTFERTGLSQSTAYTYYIKAVPFNSSILPSYSNKSKITTGNTIPPKFIAIKGVTVTGPNTVLVTCAVDSLADISGYRLTRSEDPNGPFLTVLDIGKTNRGTLYINDNTALTQEKSYYYKIQVINSCGSVALTSTNTGHTILLVGSPEDEFINAIRWNAYSPLDPGYSIYRSIDGAWQALPIKTVPGGNLDYLDDVKSYLNGNGNFCYRIGLRMPSGNDSSSSNIFCMIQSPRLYVPNAFSPLGINKVFHPISVFDDSKSYVLMIYNRWGDKIFETNDPHEGWDGTVKGALTQQGVYVYVVYFTGLNGLALKRSGTVEMIR